MAANRRPTRAPSPIDELEHPPFPGYDRAAFTFLKQLKRNNTREWLTPERKETYRVHLLEPTRVLLGELRVRLAAEGLPFEPDPKTSILRLYRDTRFSSDKRPFKEFIGATVPFAGEKREGIGNYLHIEPGKCFYGGGAWAVDAAGLKRLRAAIDRDPDRLRGILERLAKSFAPVEGEALKRAPAGYDETHPAIDLLRMKQMFTTRHFDEPLACSPGLVDRLVEMTAHTREFNQYLIDTMRA